MKRLTDGTDAGSEEERTSEDPEVHSITTAAPAHSDDMHKRMVRYATAMGIRMVCIILLLVVDGWFKLIAAAGAVFLPWIAVVIANAQDKADTTSDALLAAPPPAELEGGWGASSEADVLSGEVVDGADDDEAAQAGDAPRAGDASADRGGDDSEEELGQEKMGQGKMDQEKRSA
ncbi:MAG TPA: DUF3099 domain-containing protein [Sinomonas sp.]|nr:DUF3099 domain-containing protein [Sinomonas sp.]